MTTQTETQTLRHPAEEDDGAEHDHGGPLTTADDARRFILAGNAYLTARSQRTGKHYTFRISQPDEDRGHRPGEIWFVSLLIAPDKYAYLGTIKPMARALIFRTSRKSCQPAESPPARAFAYLWTALETGGKLPAECDLLHEGRCGRCGRQLTVPESIARGIGPDCWERMGAGPTARDFGAERVV
jgi:hypothetical protein